MSPAMTLARPVSIAEETLFQVPRTKLSRMRTSDAPASRSWSTIVLPTNPAPPVTRKRAPEMRFILPPQLVFACRFLSPVAETKDLSRDACDDRVFRNVVRYYGTCPDNRMRADSDARQKTSVHPDIGAETHAQGLNHQSSCDNRHINRIASVSRTQDLRAWPPANVVLKNNVARIEISVRTDPDVITDFAGAIVTSLDHRLSTDKHRVAELHRLRMFKYHAGTNLKIITDRLAKRSHRNPAHHAVEHALA